ncbi:response regulator [Cohnella ginsengisoli]|uniref:Response regulator n=1 Tax=Cohnella ginsengisoli TaxID=425004 RepID=A0A9X4QLF0_9BACL|nr:response regulator [Cohnella ginsengisoli]MDG0790027.1 response regulator [Cohnella ginsengisoli]
MYRVIIADDETSIRQGIRKILQRFAPQWELVGEAEDGETAMREIVRLQPDLVILDYRMPGMNGIDCCERIAADSPHIHRILLTAYQEFQLAKQAIDHGVAAFITKPLDRGELLQTLDKIAQAIDHARGERARLDALRHSLQKAAPLAEKLYYQHFLFGQDDQEIAQLLVEAGYQPLHDREGQDLIVLAVSPDWIEPQRFRSSDEELFRYALTKFVQEWCAEDPRSCVLQDHIGQVVVLMSRTAGDPAFASEARGRAAALKQAIEQSFRRAATIGMSGLYPFAAASGAYRDASLAVTYRLVCGGGQLLSLPELRADKKMNLSSGPAEQIELSLEQLLLGNGEEALAIFERLAGADLMLPVELRRMTTHYLLRLGAQLRLMDLDLSAISGKSLEDWLQAAESAVTRDSLMGMIGTLLRLLAQTIAQERTGQDAPLLQRVQQYVSESLAEGVSLQSVADRFGMNASYFSRRFKYETGRNFVVFLKECRMERAKTLIEQSERSLQEISELIGYADLKHFYRVFKEYTSYSPTEYKRRHGF